MQRSGAGGIRAVLALLAGVCCAVAVVVAGSGVPAGASADIAPGACGSVLLAGSAWLGGLGVDVRSNGQDEGTGADCSAAQSKVGGVPAGEEWQCPELVNRLYLSRGWITETWHGSAGPALWDDTPGQL
ncbi:hypothetical protein, partial [Trebonia sp.]|uniref:hypothetical protein n=1 Tax=Trebonia sp. TaxID=2767075 RepID=UPI002612D1B0